MSVLSDFYATATIFALGVAFLVIYVPMDRRIWQRSTAIMTGVIEGQPISMEYRRHFLRVGWVTDVGVMIAITSAGTYGFVLLGSSVSSDPLKGYAYLSAVITGSGALGWSMQAPFWYHMLRSRLREAAQDSP